MCIFLSFFFHFGARKYKLRINWIDPSGLDCTFKIFRFSSNRSFKKILFFHNLRDSRSFVTSHPFSLCRDLLTSNFFATNAKITFQKLNELL